MNRVIFTVASAAILSACANTHGAQHTDHAHAHKADCGHVAVAHNDHNDYLHDGHMHFAHEGHMDEHTIEVSAANPVTETSVEASLHSDHVHAAGDTQHAMIPHGDHTDYLHDGHLHHVHGDHMDEHGKVEA